MNMLFGKLNNEYLKGKQQEKTVTPTTEGIVVEPDLGYDGLSQVTVVGDADLVPNNIVKGVDIFGVEGTREVGVFPSGNQDITTLDEYDVYNKATARIPSNERAKIIPENIVEGVSILGVDGTYTGVMTDGYKVTFIVNSSEYAIVYVKRGESVTKPTDPNISGYYFDGWFTQPNGEGTKIKFPFTPNSNVTLYAATPQKLPYLKFSSTGSFELYITAKRKTWDGITEYSVDGNTWNVWIGTETLTSGLVDSEYVLYLRGTNNTVFIGDVNWGLQIRPLQSGTYYTSCSGDVEALLDYTMFMNNEHPVMGDYALQALLRDSNIISAPRVSVMNTSLRGLMWLFAGCTSLVSPPPILPAKVVAERCYFSMFMGCTALQHTPIISATEVGIMAYNTMFSGCSSLEEIVELPAKVLRNNSYQQMYQGCSKIKISTQQDSEYMNSYRIPSTGSGIDVYGNALSNMFTSTGGSFIGTPTINTTYYTSNVVISADD